MFESGIDFDYEQFDFLKSIEDEFISTSSRTPRPMQDISNFGLKPDSISPLNVPRTRNVGKTVTRRKFPGPAGLLPERTVNQSLLVTEQFYNELENEKKQMYCNENEEIVSQASETKFENGAWMAMTRDLDFECRSVMSLVNLNSVQKLGRQIKKIPFLAVLIQSVDTETTDPTLVLKDPYGEIHGTLHKDVIEQFYKEIVPGNVIVMRNVAVITSGILSRKQLVITENNLVTFYTHSDGRLQARQVGPLGDINLLKYATSEWLDEKPTPTKKRPSLGGGIEPHLMPPMKNPRVQPNTSSPSTSHSTRVNIPSAETPTFDIESLLAGIDVDALYEDF